MQLIVILCGNNIFEMHPMQNARVRTEAPQ